MSDNERDPIQDPIEDEEEVSIATLYTLMRNTQMLTAIVLYQLDFSSLKKKKKSKKKVEFEDEVEQASETATPDNEINEGNFECRLALFIACNGSFTNLITWQIEAADEEDPEQMFADLKMKKKKKKVKTEVIDLMSWIQVKL